MVFIPKTQFFDLPIEVIEIIIKWTVDFDTIKVVLSLTTDAVIIRRLQNCIFIISIHETEDADLLRSRASVVYSDSQEEWQTAPRTCLQQRLTNQVLRIYIPSPDTYGKWNNHNGWFWFIDDTAMVVQRALVNYRNQYLSKSFIICEYHPLSTKASFVHTLSFHNPLGEEMAMLIRHEIPVHFQIFHKSVDHLIAYPNCRKDQPETCHCSHGLYSRLLPFPDVGAELDEATGELSYEVYNYDLLQSLHVGYGIIGLCIYSELGVRVDQYTERRLTQMRSLVTTSMEIFFENTANQRSSENGCLFCWNDDRNHVGELPYFASADDMKNTLAQFKATTVTQLVGYYRNLLEGSTSFRFPGTYIRSLNFEQVKRMITTYRIKEIIDKRSRVRSYRTELICESQLLSEHAFFLETTRFVLDFLHLFHHHPHIVKSFRFKLYCDYQGDLEKQRRREMIETSMATRYFCHTQPKFRPLLEDDNTQETTSWLSRAMSWIIKGFCSN